MGCKGEGVRGIRAHNRDRAGDVQLLLSGGMWYGSATTANSISHSARACEKRSCALAERFKFPWRRRRAPSDISGPGVHRLLLRPTLYNLLGHRGLAHSSLRSPTPVNVAASAFLLTWLRRAPRFCPGPSSTSAISASGEKGGPNPRTAGGGSVGSTPPSSHFLSSAGHRPYYPACV